MSSISSPRRRPARRRELAPNVRPRISSWYDILMHESTETRFEEITADAQASPIHKKLAEGEMHDLMDGAARWEIKVHDHGLVALVDVMPRMAPKGQTADAAIVQAA